MALMPNAAGAIGSTRGRARHALTGRPAGYFGGFSSPVVPAANLQHKPRRLSVGGHSICSRASPTSDLPSPAPSCYSTGRGQGAAIPCWKWWWPSSWLLHCASRDCTQGFDA